MPRSFELTWDARNRRWRVMYRGKRYVVSCRQLGAPETKEGSYRKANEWWHARKHELDSDLWSPGWQGRWREANPASAFYQHSRIAIAERQREWCLRHGETDLADQLAARIEVLKTLGPDDEPPLDPSTEENIRSHVSWAWRSPRTSASRGRR